MSKVCHLIAVGKLKNADLSNIENHYLKQINQPFLQIHEIRALSENPTKEALQVVEKIQEISKKSISKIILLMENGKLFNSTDFSQWLYNSLEKNNSLIFVLGGVQGHGAEVLKLPHEKLSLSPMTFPHMLARILFVEQYYRAQTIKKDHPYHY